MDYPIYYRGKEIGAITVTDDGLYWQLTAWCRGSLPGVQRLYGAAGQRTEAFGVLAPAGEHLHLHRRLSKRSCPILPERWILGREAEGFLPWMGTVEDLPIPEAMLRTEAEGQILALPAESDPMPLAEYAPQMNAVTLDGRKYLTLRLKNGLPEAEEDREAEA